MITPVDIETVDFKKVALGYSPDEVDEFLDKVIVEFEMLYKDNARLNDRVKVLEDGIKYYRELEETIKNSIILAEKTAAEAKRSADKSSEQIIRDAQLKASDILQDANKKLYEIEYKAMNIKNQYDSLKTKLRLLLKTELEMLENSSDDDSFHDSDDMEYNDSDSLDDE